VSSSLVELENSLNNYEAKHYCNFTKSNSRTIEGAKKKGLKRYINPKLEYAEIDYVCVNGGQYKTQSKGIRPQQRFVYKNYIDTLYRYIFFQFLPFELPSSYSYKA